MKFLVSFGFFAGAMALATPVEGFSDSQADLSLQAISNVNTRQEPEAVSLDKRNGSKVWFKIPTNPDNYLREVLMHGLAVTYIMARNKAWEHGSSAAKYLCKAVMFVNATGRTLLIRVYTDDETPIKDLALKPGDFKMMANVAKYTGDIIKAYIYDLPSA
ncbi:hypothetical protein EsDP_00000489 [Epichloe bromicola]|uniref:Uncharacterized protein n=1 Tax=Epichloe bromicola TaxID=79588 RepID=A0ABQ0CF33_9HYPO